ncbi:metallophosphoesterase [Metabacillus niabensis]|uniref:MPP superfamily phosphohydrolase n=1 Tax=Metabacillus niabensis TaxID=324854 RepID=A0ABT9Z1K6_9BACI|nr:metallophosphoesterase [Metabacillus niabensis]MDQ0225727.1 putative MPP superfamily phosphohydrolase [Metabacillus niabensis]
MSIFFITVVVIFLYALIKKANNNTKDVVVNRIEMGNEGSNEDDSTLSILQLSDLHLENISISPDGIYEKLKDEQLDLIVLTGDFLDRKRTIPKLIPYLEKLNQLKSTYGIYAVLGNHDYVLKQPDLQTLIDTLVKYNCKVLKNQHDIISAKGTLVNIIGIDDFSTKRSNIEASYKGIQSGINLVITHDPNIVLQMKNYHFDYLLAGHFHGGQICYPKAYHLAKMGKLARMNMIKGLHNHDGKPFYINEGLGQTGVNIRVGSRPEMTLHKLSLGRVSSEAVKAI